MNVLTRMDDADAGANTLDLPFRFYPCLAAGLRLLHIYERELQKELACLKLCTRMSFKELYLKMKIEHLLE